MATNKMIYLVVQHDEQSSGVGTALSSESDGRGRDSIGSASLAQPADTAIEPFQEMPKRRRNPVILGVIAIALLILTGVIFAISPRDNREIVQSANTRIFLCTETGKHFAHEVADGESEPIESPFSGKRTAWMAEACYWTKAGKKKDTPTYVILNERMGKPGPTQCPDCARVVVGHNPVPGIDSHPASSATP